MTAARVTPGAHCSTSTSSGYLGIVGGSFPTRLAWYIPAHISEAKVELAENGISRARQVGTQQWFLDRNPTAELLVLACSIWAISGKLALYDASAPLALREKRAGHPTRFPPPRHVARSCRRWLRRPPVMQKPLGFAYARPLGPWAQPIAVSDRGYSVGQTTLPTRMGAHDRTC